MTDDIYEDNASGGLMDIDDIDADIQTISYPNICILRCFYHFVL